ncbi:hypothetical protein HDU97_001807 [Phlyctochytrium planicorne]|nr:hypothetical protein HDU97_001807 [Phlyctochytrium planicorne]
MDEHDSNEASKRKRQTQSCDRCREKKRRCDALRPSCTNCLKADAVCTMLVEPKKRGPKRAERPDDDTKPAKRRKTSKENGDPQPINFHSETDSVDDEDRKLTVVGSDVGFGSDGSRSDQGLVSGIGVDANGTASSSSALVAKSYSPLSSSSSMDLISAGSSPFEFKDSDFSSQNWPLTSNSSPLRSDQSGSPWSAWDLQSCLDGFNLGLPQMDPLLSEQSAAIFLANAGSTSSLIRSPSIRLPSPLQLSPDIYDKVLTMPNTTEEALQWLSPTKLVHALPVDEAPVLGGLLIADLPDTPGDFFLHLIQKYVLTVVKTRSILTLFSLKSAISFFAFFHQSLPIIDETQFFESLIPVNKHHPMLLCAIYSIGCLWSRHPLIFKPPFYSPQRASAYFASRAATLIPATASKSFRNFETIFVCQAALLLSVGDFGCRRGQRSWMYTGMGCSQELTASAFTNRLAQRLDIAYLNTVDDFISIYNGKPKPAIVSGIRERKRVWWGALIIDTYVTLSTGDPFLINEEDHLETFQNEKSLIAMDYWDTKNNVNIQDEILSLGFDNRWYEYIYRPMRNTVFPDATIDTSFRDPGCFFVNSQDACTLVQLCYHVRKIIRHVKGKSNLNASSQGFTNSFGLPNDPSGGASHLTTLHNQLIDWYNNLNDNIKMIGSLDLFLTQSQFLSFGSVSFANRPLLIQLNLLFFSAIVLLHHRNVAPFLPQSLHQVNLLTYKVSRNSSSAISSLEWCILAYRAQCRILRMTYGTLVPPSPSSPPPMALGVSPIVPCLLMPTAYILLDQPTLTQILLTPLAEARPGQVMDSLPSLFLPVLDNLSQIWPVAASYSSQLRQRIRVSLQNLSAKSQ